MMQYVPMLEMKSLAARLLLHSLEMIAAHRLRHGPPYLDQELEHHVTTR
jgi:hypothetical protein